MKENFDLLNGDIKKILIRMSLPIILTNFIQTAYGMVDMIWIGRLGSGAVAAIGTASFYINLALALFALIMIGSGVKISHAIGKGEKEESYQYIKAGLVMSIILAFLYILFIFVFKKPLISFYDLGDVKIESMAINYLLISTIGVPFMYLNSLFSTILNSFGNSKTPFKANTIGFVLNIVLDPLLIFGVGTIPGFGVEGAAFATLLGRIIVTLVFIKKLNELLGKKFYRSRFNLNKAIEIFKMGVPVSIQRVSFTLISMILGKVIADFGATAIAVQKVGLQIESISYMTVGGLQGAIAAFVGQNYGSKNYERIKDGYKRALKMTVLFGGAITVVFIIFAGEIFKIFINEKEAVAMGINYMRILALSQTFMCIEILTVGAFNGIGKTYGPPIVSVIFTALRIPMALAFASIPFIGLNGIWISISLSSILKGIILLGWFSIILKKLKCEDVYDGV